MQLHSKNGFTLIEMVTVIAILGIVGATLTNLIVTFYRSNSYVIEEGTAVQSAQRGLDQSVKDLREASYGDDGSYPIADAEATTITFYADTDDDGSVEKVRIYLSGNTLYRGITYSTGNPPTYAGQPEHTDTIATYVINGANLPVFQYYDSTGTLLTSPVDVSKVASIDTTLDIDVDPNRSPSPYTLTGSATLRNLR